MRASNCRSSAWRAPTGVLLSGTFSRDELVNNLEKLGIASGFGGASAELAINHHRWRARDAVTACKILRNAKLLIDLE